MERIKLDTIKAYFQDRVKELRNQLPNGDVFIFIGIAVVYGNLSDLVVINGRSVLDDLPSRNEMSNLLDLVSKLASDIFKGNSSPKVRLTHDISKHLTYNTIEDREFSVNLAAEPCLDYLDMCIEYVFGEIVRLSLTERIEDEFNQSSGTLFGYN